jgi:predicted permease
MVNRLIQLWRRLLFYLWGHRFDRELEEEIRTHLKMKTEQNIKAGMSPQQARNTALREFGNVTLVREDSRDMWAFRSVETLWQDLRYGMRVLVKSPVLTLVALLSLGLGIGANTAMFSLLDATLLEMLPVRRPEQLVLLNWTSGPKRIFGSHQGNMRRDPATGQETGTSFSYPVFEQLRDHNQSLDMMAFAELDRLNVSVDGQAELAKGQLVSGNYYEVLGVEALLGRPITAQDDMVGADPVAVISYGYWRHRFGGEASVIGQPIDLNGSPFTIIGVTPRGFSGTLEVGTSPDVTLPVSTQILVSPKGPSLSDANFWWLRIMGRPRPSVSDEQARADLDVTFQQVVTANPVLAQKKGDIPQVILKPGGQGISDMREGYSQPLWILMGVVGLVLLIACANIANLLLGRAEARQKEIAVRLALGASRLRLIRQLLTESVLLAIMGGVLGVALAYWGKDLLLSILPDDLSSQALDSTTSTRTLVFTSALSLLVGILFGLAPALRSTRVDLTPALKNSASKLGRGRSRLSLSKALVVVQVALSLLLLVGAGLFVRTLQNLRGVELGFNPENVLLFKIDPTLNGYRGERLANVYDQITERIRALPGVESVGLSDRHLIGGGSSSSNMTVPGYTPQPSEKMNVWILLVGGDFFDVMQIPVLAGRKLGPQDNEKSAKVAIINETMARMYFNGEDPIGRRFSFGATTGEGKIEIVGVVRDTKNERLRKAVTPTVYIPYKQAEDREGMAFKVRTMNETKGAVAAIREAVQSIDTNLPLFDVRTQVEQINRSLVQERLFATLSSFFGLLALLLALIGLYGIMSYSVARRTHEIGIRMALGAQPGNVRRMVMRETLLMVLIGLVVGLPVAVASTRVVSSMLFGLAPTDPTTIIVAILFLVGVSVMAGYLPARKASKLDPLLALRYE